MVPLLSLLFLAFAVSLDGFGVGVTYGLRKIRIPLLSVAIISCCSGAIIFTSMQIGVYLSRFLPPVYAKVAGAVILIGIGVWALYQLTRQKQEEAEEQAPEEASPPDAVPSVRQVISIELKRLGLVIQILRTPSIADVDRSGNISASEATLLGLALSLDAFGAGIGAALIGFAPLLTSAVIALASGTFLAAGLRVGFMYAELSWVRKLSVLPGCVLIIMGIMKLL
ncbi:sporulation membrane protein YtaF [Paenibacillus hamazuiensis]|uniref:sporulation membrane protein YtaF n=1 Tax=Paenibacillus hamazuiensis TaxID=2936508 RepID=UPI0020108EA3|nr:sporulation membrane protein YtaF [Paenibacillus hamazuiensis]